MRNNFKTLQDLDNVALNHVYQALRAHKLLQEQRLLKR